MVLDLFFDGVIRSFFFFNLCLMYFVIFFFLTFFFLIITYKPYYFFLCSETTSNYYGYYFFISRSQVNKSRNYLKMSDNSNNNNYKDVNMDVFEDSYAQEHDNNQNMKSNIQNSDSFKEEKTTSDLSYKDKEEMNKHVESVKNITNFKSEWKRAKNLEESSPFIFNLFFFFYFPYICRIKPIREEDIPVIAEEDESELNTKKLKDHWDSLTEQYLKELKEFEQKQKENLKFA